MITIEISEELFCDLQGLCREGEGLTEALERIARTLSDSGVVVTHPGSNPADAWRRGSLDTPVEH